MWTMGFDNKYSSMSRYWREYVYSVIIEKNQDHVITKGAKLKNDFNSVDFLDILFIFIFVTTTLLNVVLLRLNLTPIIVGTFPCFVYIFLSESILGIALDIQNTFSPDTL